MKRVLSVLALMLTAGMAHADRVNFDEVSFNLNKANAAIIKAQVTTINTKSGNTSSVILYIDGIEVARKGGDRAEHTLVYTHRVKGAHVAKAVCSNTRADADTCILTISADQAIDL